MASSVTRLGFRLVLIPGAVFLTDNWPNFIPEIISASKNNLALCENNMIILKLLSEEIFDFSSESMSRSLSVFAPWTHH